jgi:hypothetical protein
MKKYFLCTFIFVKFYIVKAQSPTFEWARNFGASSSDYGVAIFTDLTGNVYSAGNFSGIVDFDTGAGTFTLSSLSNNGYILQLNGSGNFSWAKQVGEGGSVTIYNMKTDIVGNLFIVGSFSGTADFDPSAGTSTLISQGQIDAFILKLDPSGAFVWVKQLAGPMVEVCNDLVVDGSGNVSITGFFQDTVDFDPGPSTYTVSSAGFSDPFVLRLNSGGNFVFAKSFSGATASGIGNAIETSSTGAIYIIGNHSGTTDFDPGPGTYTQVANGNNIFVTKLDNSGNFVWVKQLGEGSFAVPTAVVSDASDNLFITGYFMNSGDFDPSPAIYSLVPPSGAYDAFVLKLDNFGDLVWAKNTGGSGSDFGWRIFGDISGNIYVSGGFELTADFDPGVPVSNLTSAGNRDAYILKLDPVGNFVWATTMGAVLNDEGRGIYVDTNENVFTTGTFDNTPDFDPGAGTFTISSAGGNDAYVLKLKQIPAGISEFDKSSSFKIFPNPFSEKFMIESEDNEQYSWEIRNVLGDVIMTSQLNGSDEVDLGGVPNGIYFVRLYGDKTSFVRKIVKE